MKSYLIRLEVKKSIDFLLLLRKYHFSGLKEAKEFLDALILNPILDARFLSTIQQAKFLGFIEYELVKYNDPDPEKTYWEEQTRKAKEWFDSLTPEHQAFVKILNPIPRA